MARSILVDNIFISHHSIESERAIQLASIIFDDAPTVVHTSLSSADSIDTLTIDSVASDSFTTLTL